MQSLLRVVGFGSEAQKSRSFGSKEASPLPSARRSRATSFGLSDDNPLPSEEALLPDLASIAAATEKGILVLEEEARSFERLRLLEALPLVRRWSQALRRKPRPEEPLASFRAQFLRSNALEKALEGLRRNEPIRHALLDRPLFAAPDASDPAEALLSELTSIVQFCLPRSAAPLAAPALRAVFAESSEATAAALTAVRALKDDWAEVVRCQASRGLERRLDSLSYELQKSAISRQASSRSFGPEAVAAAAAARRASRDHVAVLALLCEALSGSYAAAASQPAKIARALRDLGLSSEGGSSSSRGRRSEPGLPSISDCEAAVTAMVRKTEESVREGLELLGLPRVPLHFVPNLELRLCGHDIRVAVNAMIAHWLEDDRPAFFDVLQRLRRTVQLPADFEEEADEDIPWKEAELRVLRAELLKEREVALKRLRSLERRLQRVDERLGQAGGVGCDVSPSPRSRSLSTCRGISFAVSPPTPCHPSSWGPSRPSRSPSRGREAWDQKQLAPEFASIITRAAEALAAETQRTLERLATQLQQRRAQLLSGLSSHLEGEREQLALLAARESDSVIDAQLGDVLCDARRLIEKVEAVTSGNSRPSSSWGHFSSGRRCRARWMDGNFYDATIQSVLGDGNVVVNWLRPRPQVDEGSPDKRPLITISDTGGDDTLHRIVPKADVQLEESSIGKPTDSVTAVQLFQARSDEDLLCMDCDAAGADWAAVSFGIYLCRSCAEQHGQLGARQSLVRLLNDGWGWNARDLQYLSVGGNSAFRSFLARYPSLLQMPPLQRYASRFGEYYRRHLDAICTGAQLPQMLPADVASQPASGDFLSAAEAAVVASEVSRRFEAAAQLSFSQARHRSSGSAGPFLGSIPLPRTTPKMSPSRSTSLIITF